VNRPNDKFAEGCDALAEAFEAAGKTELSALCDRAAYWLRGGTGIDLISVQEVVDTCRQTLSEALDADALDRFLARTAAEVIVNVQEIQKTVALATAKSGRQGDLIDTAAKVQALAILTNCLFRN